MKIDYEGKTFRSVSNSAAGEVGTKTVFHYRQHGRIVSAEYSGGEIASGHLLATCDHEGCLDMTYHHVNPSGKLMAGVCNSTPEILLDGRIRLYESWTWTLGGQGSGESTIEEILRSSQQHF